SIAATAAKAIAGKKREKVAIALDGWSDELVAAGVCGATVGCVGQDLYRASKSIHSFHEIAWSGASQQALDRGAILGDAMNLTRRVVNEPPHAMYPESFAVVATEMANQCGLECEVWDDKRLKQEKAGALLAVAKGSDRDPQLVILRHNGGGKEAPTLALVGKGVTFDSGGLSLKPSDSMKTMKCDMAGAGTVLGAMQAISRLQLPVNVIGLMGLVENMPGAKAMKLGDVLTARSGKTIEVLNTDAEGRLVLADVLDVAVELGADRIIDLATLTGACVVALGNDVAGLMTNDQSFCDDISAAATRTGEQVWQLPMFPEFADQIKSQIADIKNIGDGRWGGAITAGKFLEEFVQGKTWTHIDIAGPAFLDKPKPWLDGGASGCLVRTLVEVAETG
ncbi:MAG: leucyl aminopeptidase, partial [Pirellulales bacterium]|nr:leucyl aminopeptidase [Pirellulales bacterium]